jgi:metal-responsive CopG/Arc/MetJ family transcriptional regulator
MDAVFQPLREAVQTNCHIADARHASDYTLCVYLLKMREYFRWEQGYAFGASLPGAEVGEWLMAREALWEGLEERPYQDLAIGQVQLPPFESDLVNAHLLDRGLVYSGGLGHNSRPHFFLADLERVETRDGYRILISSREHARDLTAPPAMSQGNTIYVRRESFRRMLWEKLEEWRWHKNDNPMGRAIASYDFEHDLEQALDQMTDNEVDVVVLHELGEVMAGRQLGSQWQDMLSSLSRSRSEIMARAVRDHLADALSTLPALLERRQAGSLHFYMANLNGMRQEIFPSLREAYEDWRSCGRFDALQQLVATARSHWMGLAEGLLELHRRHGRQAPPHMETLIDRHHL